MIVTLREEERISSLLLSGKKNETYWVKDWKSNDKLFSIEVRHGGWIAKATSRMWFVDEQNHRVGELCMQPFHLYSFHTTEGEKCGHVIVEPDAEFKRYRIPSAKDIYIGRGKHNDICLKNLLVSSVHAKLSRAGDRWIIQDEDSSNGVYVNNVRIKQACVLKPGDVIYIMGFRMIVGKGFFAFSSPDNMVTVNETVFYPFCKKLLKVNKKKKHQKINIEPDYYLPGRCLPMKEEYYSVEQCKDIIISGKDNLWERSLNEGNAKTSVKLKIGTNQMLDLKDYSMIGVKSSQADAFAFAKGLLLQLLSYYSYADLKVIFLLDEISEKEFRIARWLPHVWDNYKEQSFFVKDIREAEQLIHYIKKKHNNLLKITMATPQYIIFGFHRELEEIFIQSGVPETSNITMLSFLLLDENTSIPLVPYNMLLEFDKNTGIIYDIGTNTMQEFIPDIYIRENIDLLYLQLSNTQLDLGIKINQCIDFQMVELYVPAHSRAYDIRIPRNKRIGDLLPEVKKQIMQQSGMKELLLEEAVLCETEAGIVLDAELTPEQSGVLNGTRLMLI